MSDAEPRRSVRSTKGQHKSLDQLDQPAPPVAPAAPAAPAADEPAVAPAAAPVPKKRGRKAGVKKLNNDQRGGSAGAGGQDDDNEEEIIRCVCGAREQDGDPGEPWIACDRCTAWQHNVCMGMSVYAEDLGKDYFCEQCKPENHKELLEGIARGEEPWLERRRQYEEEKANEKKRKGGRKPKGKRNSDAKEGSAKPSPTPEARRDAKGPLGTKRKTRADSEDQDGKKRKLSEAEALPVYNPPDDLPKRIADLVDVRQTPAKGLGRAISEVLGGMQKRGEFDPADGASVEATAERFAIQIERAVHDVHPSHKEYGAQIRTLRFNLKENHDLCARLLRGSLVPPMLATMTSDELASRELQQKTAKMKAQSERQSILDTDDLGAPRVRRTHKGEELVERDTANVAAAEERPSVLRRHGARDGNDGTAEPSQKRGADTRRGANLRVETKTESTNKKGYDLKRVLSIVRSPSSAPNAHQRRPSQPQLPPEGPGDDPDVDRLLEDDVDESPPYSPAEESDPDVVWRGQVSMTTVANFQATARHVGGVNLSTTIGLPWTTLVPKNLTVAGRIDEQIATEYLCSLRYSAPTDITVVSLGPATEEAKAGFLTLIDYFTLRHRYGVVGEKGVGNVRDTYLVPVPAGTSSHPEFMLNLEDNFIPTWRAAPMLLLVVVYRNEAEAMEKLRGPNWAGQYPAAGAGAQASSVETTPSNSTPAPPIGGGPVNGGGPGSRNASISAPAFSPTVPQGPTPTPPLPPATPQLQSPHSHLHSPVPSAPSAPSVLQSQVVQHQQPLLQPQPPQASVQPLAARPVPPPALAPQLQQLPLVAPTPASPAIHHPQTVAHPGAVAAVNHQQLAGEAVAREILGPLASCSAAGFLMSQAAKMQKNEWMLVRSVFEQQPQTRDDLQLLRQELERYNEQSHSRHSTPAQAPAQLPPTMAAKPPQTPVPIPRVPHTSAASVPAVARPVQQAGTAPGTQPSTRL